MENLIVSGKYYRKLLQLRERDIQRAKKKFLKKGRNHLNDPKLAEFYSKLQVEFSDKLYEIKFKCCFTLYLYLYLKSQAKSYYEDEPKRPFNISQPINVNLQRIVNLSGIARNTVKRALEELKQLRFINQCKYVSPEYHNSTKEIMLVNDHFMLCYDNTHHCVHFTIDPK